MKTTKANIFALSILLAVSACENEGDKIILSGQEPAQLIGTETDVVLTPDNKASLVLSLSWNNSTLTLSNESMGIPTGIPAVTLQASAGTDFATVVELPETATSHSFLGAELNTLAKKAGLAPAVASPLYFRIKSMLGPNLDPVYSEAVTVNVTPYLIDMSRLFVLDSKKEQTLDTLYSPTSNGEYAGFMSATAWMNFYMLEGDGNIWGNDGVSGTAFVMSNDTATMWNGWFPGNNGCYYVTMSTAGKTWTAAWLTEMTVGGDVKATLAFSTSKKVWSGTVTTTADNAKITLSSPAKRYNVSTGTDDAAAIAATYNFAEAQSGVLTVADIAGNINIATAGTYTLTVDLNDASNMVYTLTEGAGEPEPEVIPFLYLAGIDDAVTGPNWNFDKFLTQGTDGLYTGVVYANSLWGFKMYTAAAWGDYYTMGATEGTLAKNADGNIPAPETGTYLITVDLVNLTYKLKKLGDVLYLSGLNDVWDFNTSIAKTGNGTYSGTVTVTAKSAWGFKLYIESDNWDNVFGGSGGTITYKGNGITDDAPGTYTLTVDLIQGTYQMTLN